MERRLTTYVVCKIKWRSPLCDTYSKLTSFRCFHLQRKIDLFFMAFSKKYWLLGMFQILVRSFSFILGWMCFLMSSKCHFIEFIERGEYGWHYLHINLFDQSCKENM